MRKVKKPATDELRSEYKRSDFGTLVRGKYVKRVQTLSSLTPKLPTCFQTRRRSTLRCGPWRRLPSAPVLGGVDCIELRRCPLLRPFDLGEAPSSTWGSIRASTSRVLPPGGPQIKHTRWESLAFPWTYPKGPQMVRSPRPTSDHVGAFEIPRTSICNSAGPLEWCRDSGLAGIGASQRPLQSSSSSIFLQSLCSGAYR